MKCLCLTPEAGEGRWGTDELAFNEVLAKRSYKQLRATFQAYQIVSDQAPGQGVHTETEAYVISKRSRNLEYGTGGWGVVLQQGVLNQGSFCPHPPQGYLIVSGNI